MERRQLDLHEKEYMNIHFKIAMKEMKQKVRGLEVELSNRDLEYSFVNEEL